MIIKVTKGKKILEKVQIVARDAGVEVFAVGGFVRDLYLKSEGKDIDFVVIGNALDFAERFKKRFRSGQVVTYPRFGTAMLIYQNYKLEFVSARSEYYDEHSRKPHVSEADLESDLSRRDFTINTLAMDISPENFGSIIDVYNGIDDIKRKLIRTPLDPVVTFSDDPLRILRAVRFAAVLNFKIEEKTYRAIIETRERLEIISQERITEEFRKMMMASKPSIGLQLMKETGLLSVIFPELDQLSGVDQRKDYHHKDVFNHTLQVVDNISRKTKKFELRLAALLHDIAKPQTKRFVEGTGWTFHGHEELGARMSERICRRMRLPVSIIKYVQKLVRLHLRPMQLVDEEVTDSAIRRVMVEAGDSLEDLMLLCRADVTSKNPQKVKRYLSNFDIVEEKMREVEEKDKLRNFKPAISGNDIMSALGIGPGPAIGEIKQAVTDAILDGIISNDYDACYNFMMQIKDRYLDKEKHPAK
ncbi:MAG: CCA tRNA nucleotidyltransferase [Calditrichia bacterium]